MLVRKTHMAQLLPRALTQIVPPDIAVLTNIKPVHLQFFKSINEIALAKKEILEGTKKNGTAVLNGDDLLVKKIAEGWKGRTLTFGFSKECDIHAQNIKKIGWEGTSFKLRYGKKQGKIALPFFYEGYIYNLLAAAAINCALSVPFEFTLSQIASLEPLPKRGTLVCLKNNIKLIDDSYNSNPAALESVLKGLADLPSKRKIAVLGDMLELGKKEVAYHIQAGRQVVKWGWDILITVGPLSKHMIKGALAAGKRKNQIFSFKNSMEAAEEIWPLIREGDLILVKGSRGIKIEKIIKKLKSKGL